MRTLSYQSQKHISPALDRSDAAKPQPIHREHPFLHLQRTIGNRAVQRMLQAPAETGRESSARLMTVATPGFGYDFTRIPPVRQEFSVKRRLQLVGDSGNAIQRQEDSDVPTIDFHGSPEETSTRAAYSAREGDGLRDNIAELMDKGVKDYGPYRKAISSSTKTEKRVALTNPLLLSRLNDTLDFLSFARCVESLGRTPPTFDELRKNSIVSDAIKEAWNQSDVGARDLVSQPHEEGGWIFMNLMDGSLHIERAKAEGTDFLRVEPAPDVKDSVLVGLFHTHPALGPRIAKPSPDDKTNDARRGVPNLVAGNTGTKPEVFQIYLSGPVVRKHLASDTKFPGPGGGIAP